MPCEIGYRSVARATIAQRPETLESRAEAPPFDQELLDRLGVDDPPFLAWLVGLEIDPLLERALERTRDAVDVGAAELRIENGALTSRVTVTDTKAAAERAVAIVTKRWQLEVLRIVCELLDYEVELGERGGALVLEGEKHGTSGVHEYISITTDAADGLEVRFEHFASDDALALEQRRFLALAQKLGVRLRITREQRAGQKIPPGTIHPHKHRGKA
jgi:hypothetical protein